MCCYAAGNLTAAEQAAFEIPFIPLDVALSIESHTATAVQLPFMGFES